MYVEEDCVVGALVDVRDVLVLLDVLLEGRVGFVWEWDFYIVVWYIVDCNSP